VGGGVWEGGLVGVAGDCDDLPGAGDGAHGVRKRGFAFAWAADEHEGTAVDQENFLHCLCNKHVASLAGPGGVREALMTLFFDGCDFGRPVISPMRACRWAENTDDHRSLSPGA
jgi:hypothetical protein